MKKEEIDNNKTSDKNVANIEDDVNELKRLLYSDVLTQYGKRKLVNYYEQRIQELEEKVKTKQKFIVMASEVIKNSIPKQVIIDLICEIEDSKNTMSVRNSRNGLLIANTEINILKKLLEGEE